MTHRRLIAAMIAAACIFGPAGCSSTDAPPDDEDLVDDSTLRGAATRHDLSIGVAVGTGLQRTDARFAQVLAREFNILTAENTMKPAAIQPTQGTFAWSEPDQLVTFAEAHDIEVRGHTLLWHEALPSWMTSSVWNREQMLAILEHHIKTLVGRYKGRIAAWDVVNEAVEWDGSLRQTLWLERIGPEYLEMAFRWAHEADPEALLFYNDFGAEGLGQKSDGVYNLVRDLLEDGVPVHGVGLQMHVSADSPPRAADLRANMARLANLGLKVHITEMDVRIPVPATEQGLLDQAVVYRNVLDACLEQDACTALVTWGLTDRHSWVPGFFEGYGAALLFDAEYEPKLAYEVMLDGLREAD
jgi:endo-1,4-beta-xylanase